MDAMMELGYVNNVRGLRGEIKVIHYCDYKEFFEELDSVILKNTEYEIESIKYYKDQVVLKIPWRWQKPLKIRRYTHEKAICRPYPKGYFIFLI